MGSRSSTSSSEPGRTWQVRLRLPGDWLGALVLVVLAEIGLRALAGAGRMPPTKEWDALERLRGIEEILGSRSDARVIVCGSSTVARLDPEAVALAAGAPAIATSYPGANTAVMAYAVERLLLERFRPEILVYGLDTQSVNEHGLRRVEQALVLGNFQLLVEEPVHWRMLWGIHDVSAVYRHQFELREWVRYPWRIRLARPRGLEPQVEARAGEWTLADSPHVFEAERGHEFGLTAEREIRRVVAAAQDRGVRPVLANMPLPADYAGYWPDGRATLERYRARLREVALRLGVALIDLDDGSFGRADFSDSHHLAPAGAARASRLLGEALRPLLPRR